MNWLRLLRRKRSEAELQDEVKAFLAKRLPTTWRGMLIPITDASGGDLNGGFVVMEVPYSKAANQGSPQDRREKPR